MNFTSTLAAVISDMVTMQTCQGQHLGDLVERSVLQKWKGNVGGVSCRSGEFLRIVIKVLDEREAPVKRKRPRGHAHLIR